MRRVPFSRTIPILYNKHQLLCSSLCFVAPGWRSKPIRNAFVPAAAANKAGVRWCTSPMRDTLSFLSASVWKHSAVTFFFFWSPYTLKLFFDIYIYIYVLVFNVFLFWCLEFLHCDVLFSTLEYLISPTPQVSTTNLLSGSVIEKSWTLNVADFNPNTNFTNTKSPALPYEIMCRHAPNWMWPK